MNAPLISCTDSGHSRHCYGVRAQGACGESRHRRSPKSSPSCGSIPAGPGSARSCFMVLAVPHVAPRRTRHTPGWRLTQQATAPGYEVRGPDGRTWDVKLGAEAQSEVVASRVLWAIGLSPARDVLRRELAAHGRPGRPAAGRALSPRIRQTRKPWATGRGPTTSSSGRSHITA